MITIVPKMPHFQIAFYSTPHYLVVAIVDSDKPAERGFTGISWQQVQQTAPSVLARQFVDAWADSHAEQAKQIDRKQFSQDLLPALREQGTSFPGVQPLPMLPPEGSLREEKMYFIGPDGFNNYQNDQLYALRYVFFTTGNVVVLPDYAPWNEPIMVPLAKFKELFKSDTYYATKIYELRNAARQTSHPCYNPTCVTGLPAISSHVLQENGVLNHAAEYNGNSLEAVELRITNLAVRTKTAARYHFKAGPITKSVEFTFWGFCDACDEDLFRNLEYGIRDFALPENQLRLAYRGLVCELFKKEYNIRFHLAVEAGDFPAPIRQSYHELRLEHAAGMLGLQEWKARIEAAIFSHAPSPFRYIFFRLPSIPIAASAILVSRLQKVKVDRVAWDKARPETPANQLAIVDENTNQMSVLHLIPRGCALDVCLAYSPAITKLAGIPIGQVEQLNEDGKIKFIGDLLVSQGETWCIAPSLFEDWQRRGHDKRVLEAIHYHIPLENKMKAVAINLLG